MKVYGFNDVGPHRGELLCTQVEPRDLDFGMESLAHHLSWEFAATSFKEAQKQLLAEMVASDIDPELIRAIRQCKASYVPEV